MKPRLSKSVISHPHGFTLLELLAAIAILAIMIALLFQAFGQASRAWIQAENRVETYSQARAALDYMSKEISQAIVNSNITFLGDAHDIAFVAPINTGISSTVDLAEVVYRLNQQSPAAVTPDPGGFFTKGATDWPKNLMRRVSVFGGPASEGWDYGLGAPSATQPWDFYGAVSPNPNWPQTSTFNHTAVLAENVMSLTFQYFDATNSNVQNYWNSNVTLPGASWTPELRPPIIAGTVGPGGPGSNPIMTNRAPASIQITLTMIDSKAAARLQGIPVGSAAFVSITNQALKTFSTFVAIPNRNP